MSLLSVKSDLINNVGQRCKVIKTGKLQEYKFENKINALP